MNNQIKLPELVNSNEIPQDQTPEQKLEATRHDWAKMAVIRFQYSDNE